MKKYKKLFFVLTSLILISWASASRAVPLIRTTETDQTSKTFGSAAGFTTTTGANSLITIINLAISGFLAMLGIVFVILLITAGFNYMRAQGDSKLVDESLASIRRAVIGLIIVVSAYAITYFVFINMPGGRNTNSGGTITGGTGQ